MKRLLTICTTLFLMMVASPAFAASAQTNTSSDGFFHHYFVQPFSELIIWLANFFHDDYGLSIMFVTLIVRLLIFPLFANQFKKQRVMQEKMALVKPQIDQIQSKLKKTKEPEKQKELQMEMMKVYKDNNVNPLAMGCLPMLIQIPIVLGFYSAIRSTPEIATHSFLWFNLGQTDLLVAILAGAMYFLQFYVTQKFAKQSGTQTEAALKQAKIMGMIFPVMMLFLSINAPAALPLYWMTSGLLLTIQTIILNVMYQKSKTKAAANDSINPAAE
ncbi:membrane protein insertase YidC [Bacillus altitudinis]|uniref:membrane protein insertase YidC n=1 Tax=Bacillus TaxID=1386 RepID=UPI0015BB5330|nr:membrane protein insertase YidC [Bacillus altitudinis]